MNAPTPSRVVCWFSCGAASTIATRLTLDDSPEAVIAYIDTRSEHPDNARYLADCEQWFGKPVERLGSTKYHDTWDVWTKRRFLVSPEGALCTAELKRKVRAAFERPDDVQVFGYTADKRDAARAERFVESNPGVNARFPLIEHGITKAECLRRVEAAGIEVPAMYRLGYQNNNCIGCVKGGMWYWNRIRVDFPETFERMAALEEELGATLIRKAGKPLPLRQLDPKAGRKPKEMACGFVCDGSSQPGLFDGGWE